MNGRDSEHKQEGYWRSLTIPDVYCVFRPMIIVNEVQNGEVSFDCDSYFTINPTVALVSKNDEDSEPKLPNVIGKYWNFNISGTIAPTVVNFRLVRASLI